MTVTTLPHTMKVLKRPPFCLYFRHCHRIIDSTVVEHKNRVQEAHCMGINALHSTTEVLRVEQKWFSPMPTSQKLQYVSKRKVEVLPCCRSSTAGHGSCSPHCPLITLNTERIFQQPASMSRTRNASLRAGLSTSSLVHFKCACLGSEPAFNIV